MGNNNLASWAAALGVTATLFALASCSSDGSQSDAQTVCRIAVHNHQMVESDTASGDVRFDDTATHDTADGWNFAGTVDGETFVCVGVRVNTAGQQIGSMSFSVGDSPVMTWGG